MTMGSMATLMVKNDVPDSFFLPERLPVEPHRWEIRAVMPRDTMRKLMVGN